MSTGIRRSGTGAPRNRNGKRRLNGIGDELDAFSEEELRRRPEVRIINKHALVLAYIHMGLKGMSALALLWATVVLLGGFVSDLRRTDFWYLTIIAFVQAAGLFDATGDARLLFFQNWLVSLVRNIISWEEDYQDERTQLPMGKWLMRQIYILRTKIIDIGLALIFFTVVYFALSGPLLCFLLSFLRLVKRDYGIADGDASKANLKPALILFYCLSLAQGIMGACLFAIERNTDLARVFTVSRQHGLSPEILYAYVRKTKEMCLSNPSSIESWNLITYGADLLDSRLPEDYVSGGRVLTMLMDQDTPVPITWLLIRSPRERIQKLIGTLAWRSPTEQEMRWLAARIVELLAGHLTLAHFPGALECISSLFDTSCHNNADQEALYLTYAIDRSKQRKMIDEVNLLFPEHLLKYIITFCQEKIHEKYGAAVEQESKQKNSQVIYEDLVLTGLRILENLAHDTHNCTLIYNTKDLLSKIVAPVSSNKLLEDIKIDTKWTKIVGGSLKVVSRLMGSSGSTGKDMRSLISDDRNLVKNLEAILDMDTERNNSVIELQMQVIEALTQLALHQPPSTSAAKGREKLIKRMLNIFLVADWMEDYLEDEKRKIANPTTSQQRTLPRQTCLDNLVCSASGKWAKEKMAKRAAEHVKKKLNKAKETASLLKEKAGEALATLSSDSEAIKSFTACKDDEVRRLTELLDSKIEIKIGCRISAAVILKHLSNYDKEPTLPKALEELLPVQPEEISTPRCWECLLPSCCRNDIENPMDSGEDDSSASQSLLIRQCSERRLQAELISLVTVIRANNNFDVSAILASRPQPVALEDFVVRLKKMVEGSMYATPACLAIQKLTCEMVIEFLQHDQNIEVIDKHNIVGTLMKASKTMVGLERSMLFAGGNRDCHGVPLKPFSSVLAKNAEDLLVQRKQALGINTPTAGVPTPCCCIT